MDTGFLIFLTIVTCIILFSGWFDPNREGR